MYAFFKLILIFCCLITFIQVVYIDLVCPYQTPLLNGAVSVGLGDPLRKNTLCVEIQFCGEKVTLALFKTILGDIRILYS